MKHFADHASLRRWATSSLGLLLVVFSFAQNIAVGTWRTHFNYTNAQLLVNTDEKVFCASEHGLFSRDVSTGETRKLSKIDGLSDVGVSTLAYHADANVLVIGYRSGYVDFVFEDGIRSFTDLADSELDVNKTVYDAAFNGTQTYLATDLGIIVVDTEEVEVEENYVNIGAGGAEVSVLNIIVRNDSLFIQTTEGIQSGALAENLLDFGNWNRYTGSSGYADLVKVGEQIYATNGENLLLLGESWSDTGVDLPAGATQLFSLDDELWTASDGGVLYRYEAGSFNVAAATSATYIQDLARLDGELFIADAEDGLVDADGNSFNPDGPLSDDFSNFRVIANEVFGFHAPSPFSYDGSEQTALFSVFSGGIWELRMIESFANVSDVARFNSSYYFASIGDGLYDESTNEIITNIPGSVTDLDTVITALASGESLWVSSFANENPVHRLDEELNWSSHVDTTLFGDEFLTIDLSDIGVAWLGSSSGTITVFEPAEGSRDLISTSDGLPSSFIDIDISIEDNAWVGTTQGPALFPSASFIFSDTDAILPSFENRTLFDGEEITAVLTDGGNRIWFGTTSGLWVYDENTSEQVAVFNESNSPLPSNQIIQLDYNDSNGEVFINTAKGMVSYRSASSRGANRHRNVNIFPNPVRPSYQGLVGLTGLARNVNVKVTDVSGNLVAELNANGGTASWNLMDVKGGQVATGVYLFFSSTADGEETYVGKIAVIR